MLYQYAETTKFNLILNEIRTCPEQKFTPGKLIPYLISGIPIEALGSVILSKFAIVAAMSTIYTGVFMVSLGTCHP